MERYRVLIKPSARKELVAIPTKKDRQWIVVTGWTPHWKFARWKLKYLDDPRGIYGGEEYISTIVRKELDKEMPEAYQILDRFHWTAADMEVLMVWNREDGADPYLNAKRWVDENPEKVKDWLP